MLRYGKTSSGLYTMNSTDLARIPVVRPPIELQLEFEQRYAAYKAIERQLPSTIARLDDLFGSFLAHSFTGELTAIWREEDVSATGLAESLANRDFSADDYAASLEGLVEKGWIEGGEGDYSLTETGLKIREEAEDKTNRLYFAAWSELSEAETAELDDLLDALRGHLRDRAADEATVVMIKVEG